MAIVIEDVELERLALQVAIIEGMPVAEVVREAVLSMAGLRGVDGPRPLLRKRFATLAREVHGLAPRVTSNTRSEQDKVD